MSSNFLPVDTMDISLLCSDHSAAKEQKGTNIMKRSNSWRIVVIMVIMAATAGCGKEDFTLPVDFQLQFSIAEKPI
ncbi:MAG: hypothetical protein PF495_09340, partial [Spirochaetales bacterium]|nr:hypothetical protein [Spirochaetales bacterium]